MTCLKYIKYEIVKTSNDGGDPLNTYAQTPSPLHPLYVHVHFWPTASLLPSMSRRIVLFKENMIEVFQLLSIKELQTMFQTTVSI